MGKLKILKLDLTPLRNHITFDKLRVDNAVFRYVVVVVTGKG